MNLEDLREYCLKKPGVCESFPFDEETLVFKVMDKMFCLTSLNPPFNINLKCDPEIIFELREKYDYVLPGYHMNKNHWNTIDLSQNVKEKLVYEWIDNSYNLVVDGLSKSKKGKLKN